MGGCVKNPCHWLCKAKAEHGEIGVPGPGGLAEAQTTSGPSAQLHRTTLRPDQALCLRVHTIPRRWPTIGISIISYESGRFLRWPRRPPASLYCPRFQNRDGQFKYGGRVTIARLWAGYDAQDCGFQSAGGPECVADLSVERTGWLSLGWAG